jgi:sulfotransferase famil protein
MIISHKHKFIFIHNYKTAGTSITQALLPYLDKNDIILGCTPEFEKLSQNNLENGLIHKHSSALEIKENLNSNIWKSYFKFAFVRNPYDLILSYYLWWHKTSGNWDEKALEQKKVTMDMNFEQFILQSAYWHILKQHKYIINDKFLFSKKVNIISKIKLLKKHYLNHIRKNIIVDYIGKYESLQHDFDFICNHFGLPKTNLSLNNESKDLRNGSRIKDYFTTIMAEKIYNTNYTDFLLFNYDKL